LNKNEKKALIYLYKLSSNNQEIKIINGIEHIFSFWPTRDFCSDGACLPLSSICDASRTPTESHCPHCRFSSFVNIGLPVVVQMALPLYLATQ
jgi:hypothetical protein